MARTGTLLGAWLVLASCWHSHSHLTANPKASLSRPTALRATASSAADPTLTLSTRTIDGHATLRVLDPALPTVMRVAAMAATLTSPGPSSGPSLVATTGLVSTPSVASRRTPLSTSRASCLRDIPGERESYAVRRPDPGRRRARPCVAWLGRVRFATDGRTATACMRPRQPPRVPMRTLAIASTAQEGARGPYRIDCMLCLSSST